MDTADVANVIADAHHRFQWIHPFKDTNGRTGGHIAIGSEGASNTHLARRCATVGVVFGAAGDDSGTIPSWTILDEPEMGLRI